MLLATCRAYLAEAGVLSSAPLITQVHILLLDSFATVVGTSGVVNEACGTLDVPCHLGMVKKPKDRMSAMRQCGFGFGVLGIPGEFMTCSMTGAIQEKNEPWKLTNDWYESDIS